jgi:hypothetical protein
MKVLLPSIFFLALAAVEIVFERRRLEARVATGVVTTQKARKRIVMLWELWFLLAAVFAVGGVLHLIR